MNRNFGIIGGILAILLIVWLITGGSITCRDSFWDSDKKVIEIEHD